jgi:hypothetical protein
VDIFQITLSTVTYLKTLSELRLYRGEMHDSQSRERVKYGHEFSETRNQERLCWRGPAAIYPTDRDHIASDGRTNWERFGRKCSWADRGNIRSILLTIGQK